MYVQQATAVPPLVPEMLNPYPKLIGGQSLIYKGYSNNELMADEVRDFLTWSLQFHPKFVDILHKGGIYEFQDLFKSPIMIKLSLS